MNNNALVSAAAAAALLVPSTSASAVEVIYQHLKDITVDGVPTGVLYTGTQDAEIREDAPATNFDGGTGGPGGTGGGDSELHVDADTPGGSGLASQALLRFDGIFGPGPGQVPLDAEITRAVLQLDIDLGGDRLAFHTLHFPWAESSVTWDNAGTPGNGIDSTTDSTLEFTLSSEDFAPVAAETVDVTAQLRAYQQDPANHHGWALLPTGPNGVDFDTKHYTDASPDGGASQRPALHITYTPPRARLIVSESPGGDAQVDILAPTAAPFLFGLDTSLDLENWFRLTTLPAPAGAAQFIDPLVPGGDLFYRAAPIPALPSIEVLGRAPIIIRPGFEPGTTVSIDLQSDGTVDHTATIGADGLLTVALDYTALAGPFFTATWLTEKDGVMGPTASFDVSITAPSNPGNAVALTSVPEPAICACDEMCPCPVTTYSSSYTPTVHGVELFTGKVRKTFGVHSFPARGIDFGLHMHHASLVQYDGPAGCGFSHSYNMMITRTGPNSGLITTPNLRIYPINSINGVDWDLPEGFFSRLTLDPDQHRWTLTHFGGRTIDFYEALQGQPGRPISMAEPNGNTMTFGYNPSGLLTSATTPLGQVESFFYTPNGYLSAFRNHLGHTWRFSYTPGNQLQQIARPSASYVQVPPNNLLDDANLAAQSAFGPRNLFFNYTDPAFPCHLTEIFDGRGALVQALQYAPTGEATGQLINGSPEIYDYGAGGGGPAPLPLLDAGNLVTRVIDRDQNICDYEIHGPAGGPLGVGLGGLRRKVTFTETAKGNPALRPGEPDFYEDRLLHDCDCLRPAKVSMQFSNADPVAFDAQGIPTNWPRREITYNAFRQPLTVLHTDGLEDIKSEYTYQTFAFGDGDEYSRRLTFSAPREFDTNPIYTGRSFVHTYQYDAAGNRIVHQHPTVTLGTGAPQPVVETWTYNAFGQPLSHTDPNGNRTVYSYFTGLSTGGDANTQGSFGGYLASATTGAPGSADGAVSLTTGFAVNALGQRTAQTDPNGNTYTWNFNDAGECARFLQPPVVVGAATTTQYETRYFYDEAGHRVLERRANIDEFGTPSAANPFIDRATAYDTIGNIVAAGTEVDETTYLVTRYAYDPNDRRIVEVRPEGNRTFTTYDERDLKLRVFSGVSPGATPAAGYPPSDADTVLVGPTAISTERYDYDGRGNLVSHVDGRGNTTSHAYDFYDRRIATSDPNGNGTVCTYDDASHRLTCSGGTVDPSGLLLTELDRTYFRFDELGREYQRVLDIALPSDESLLVDPDDGANSSLRIEFDPGSRPAIAIDAEANPSIYFYDSADRRVAREDALGNSLTFDYDDNGNVLRVTELEFPGPGLTGVGDPVSETYVTEYTYDSLNRRVRQNLLGLDGISINHETSYLYDSRNNRVRTEDPEGQTTRFTYDDLDRVIARELFETPTLGTRLDLTEYRYDDNNNAVLQRNFSDQANPATAQPTRYTYDDLDRIVRIVHPDSDDPLTGPGLGLDGVFDREEFAYDANSNQVTRIDQRGVNTTGVYDPGNRKTDEFHALPAGVPGNTRCEYKYDARNRLTEARNDYSEVVYSYDSLSRRISETQSIRLDGSGFATGYQFPVKLTLDHDRQSNQTGCLVTDAALTDLEVTYAYDPLNRLTVTTADYFGTGSQPRTTYAYYGPRRVGTIDYGNGAAATFGFDLKPRVSEFQWDGITRALTGTKHEYDQADNPLYELFTHDLNRYDHYGYNGRYEVTGAEYRSSSATPPAVFPTTYAYDSMDNRTTATYGDPFAVAAPVTDAYTSNAVNEYTGLLRSTAPLLPAPVYDLAGNATTYPLFPVGAGSDVPAAITYNARSNIFSVNTAAAPRQTYRYDALGRRIATLQGPAGSAVPDRRFVYDRWNVVSERLFDPGATPANAPSTLDRIYVCGTRTDERFLCAIDGDQDRTLVGNPNGKNVPVAGADHEHYYLVNRLGSTMGLSNADDADDVLEYYRYDVFGAPTAVPGLGPGDTDQDLDNNLGAGPFRASQFGNFYLFTGRRWDSGTGLYFCRHRYYDPRSGRWVHRDPEREAGGLNLYGYVENRSAWATDPYGLNSKKPRIGVSGYEVHVDDDTRPVKVYKDHRTYNREVQEYYNKNALCRMFTDAPWIYTIEDQAVTMDYKHWVGRMMIRGVWMGLYKAGRSWMRYSSEWQMAQNKEDMDALWPFAERELNFQGKSQSEIEEIKERWREQLERDYNVNVIVHMNNHRVRGKTGLCSWSDEIIADFVIILEVVNMKTGKVERRTRSEFTHAADDVYGAGRKAAGDLARAHRAGR